MLLSRRSLSNDSDGQGASAECVMPGFWSTATMRMRLPDLVEPYDENRIENCAYELAMGNQFHVTEPRSSWGKLRVKHADGEYVNIPPGQFAQLLVKEYIKIPNDALGLISMKSRFKMSGLVNVSGFHVDPGYEGNLVFAVFNAGSSPIVIRQDEPTFLIWYASLDEPTDDLYSGAQKGKRDISSDHLSKLKGPTYNPTALVERVSRLEATTNFWRRIIAGVIIGLILLVLGMVFDVVSVEIGRTSESSTSASVEQREFVI